LWCAKKKHYNIITLYPKCAASTNISRTVKLRIMNDWIEEYILDVSLNINLEEPLYCSAEYGLKTINLQDNSFDSMELCKILHSTLLFAALYSEVNALQNVKYLVKPSTLFSYIVNIFSFCCRIEGFYWNYKCEQLTTFLFVENVMSHLHKVTYILQQTLKDETEGVKFEHNSHFLEITRQNCYKCKTLFMNCSVSLKLVVLIHL